MANSVDPDETVPCEPSHLDLHCLQKYIVYSLFYRTERVIFNDGRGLTLVLLNKFRCHAHF